MNTSELVLTSARDPSLLNHSKLSNNRVSVERFQKDVFFSKIEAIYRYNYNLKT